MKKTSIIAPLFLSIILFFTQCEKENIDKTNQKVFDNLEEFLGALPETAKFKIEFDKDVSYLKTTVSTGGILNGIHPGYCINSGTFITPGDIFDASIYASFSLPDHFSKVDKPGNFPKVSWIINYINDSEEYTYADIQRAIWELLEDNPKDIANPPLPYNLDKVAKIIAAAQAYEMENGEFLPKCGQYVVIVIDPLPDVQPVIIWKQFVCSD